MSRSRQRREPLFPYEMAFWVEYAVEHTTDVFGVRNKFGVRKNRVDSDVGVLICGAPSSPELTGSSPQ